MANHSLDHAWAVEQQQDPLHRNLLSWATPPGYTKLNALQTSSRIQVEMCPFYYLWSCAVHVVENFPPHSSAHPTPSIRDLYCDVIFRLEYPATEKINIRDISI